MNKYMEAAMNNQDDANLLALAMSYTLAVKKLKTDGEKKLLIPIVILSLIL